MRLFLFFSFFVSSIDWIHRNLISSILLLLMIMINSVIKMKWSKNLYIFPLHSFICFNSFIKTKEEKRSFFFIFRCVFSLIKFTYKYKSPLWIKYYFLSLSLVLLKFFSILNVENFKNLFWILIPKKLLFFY
jgi:hypothetical protein